MKMKGISVQAVFLCLQWTVFARAQQCVTSQDCSSPDAPYCSRWGWCQWTNVYGTDGLIRTSDGQLTRQDGTCITDSDCTPRAPICSKQGYCTVRSFKDARGLEGPANLAGTNNIHRSFDTGQSQKGLNQEEGDEFIITDYDPFYYGAAEYEYYGGFDILKKDSSANEESRIDSSIFGGNVELVTVAPLAANPDYYNVEEDRDYAEKLDENKSHSQGCLYDCVNDCVTIDQLSAYKDCVNFCGRTCE